MTAQPRSASVVCAASGGCVVEEISGDDFGKLLKARRTGFRRDVMRMLRARQFRHGVYKLLTELGNDASFTDAVRRLSAQSHSDFVSVHVFTRSRAWHCIDLSTFTTAQRRRIPLSFA